MVDGKEIRMNNIIDITKKLIWKYIIDTKWGWHSHIQCEVDDIDVEQLMTDRAEEYAQGVSDTYG